MKAKILAFFSGAILGIGLLKAENDPAQFSGYPLERYQAILEKSPFAKEAPIEISPAGPLFGQDLVLTGHYKLGEVLYAMILNKKTQERLTASSVETQADRPRVVSFVIADDPAKSTAVIQLGVEKASLSFEKAQTPKEAQKSGENPSPKPAATLTPGNAAKTPVVSPSPTPRRAAERMRYKSLNPK